MSIVEGRPIHWFYNLIAHWLQCKPIIDKNSPKCRKNKKKISKLFQKYLLRVFPGVMISGS